MMGNKIKILIIVCGCVLVYVLYYFYNSSNINYEGIYVGKNFTKNIDSIRILPNGIYERVIYNNQRELIFKNKSTYKKHDSYIAFDNFLLNNNDIDINYEYNSNDLLNASLNTDYSLGKVKLIVDYDLDYNYLKVR